MLIISALNRRKDHCFKLARGRQRKSFMRHIPGFRSGRFLTVEDAVILRRLQSLKNALDMDEDSVTSLIIEANNHNKKKGMLFNSFH